VPEPTKPDEHVPARVVGGLIIALALVSGARDLGIGLDNFDSYLKVTPGDPLPEFAAKLDDGSAFTPATLAGEVSLLTFWATWCHACGLEMPTVDAIAEHYAERPDVRIYGINRDSGPPTERRKQVEAYLDERELAFPQVYDDGQLARAFDVEQIPYMVLVDRQGQIRHLHLGQVSERTLRSEIDNLLEEPSVTPAE
jgi:cytochrome c biogenesis protein CcmG/thiol:disulfide interchange protein DsbE